MEIYLIGLIGVAIAIIAKYGFKLRITTKEFFVQLVIGAVVLVGIWGAGRYTAARDQELFNGEVTLTRPWKFSCPTNTSNPCENGYACNFRTVCTGIGKDRRCHQEHDTCYKYAWEQNWLAETNIHKSPVNIKRIDAQGVNMPPRWAEIRPGDPVSRTHEYQNWVKASADSLFHQDGGAEEKYKDLIPNYPITVFDYYKVDRVLTTNFTLLTHDAWNLELAKALKILGPKKQMNVVVVMVRNVDRDYALAVRRAWEGFKKNDAVVFIGVDQDFRVSWGATLSWSKSDLFNVESTHYIESFIGKGIGTINPTEFLGGLQKIALTSFERRSMKEFEYLKGSIPPPNWLVWLAIILSIVLGVGLTVWLHNYDIFGDE